MIIFTGEAKVYINGQLASRTTGSGDLSQDWGSKAEIGSTMKDRTLDGFVDEFYLFTKALTQNEISVLVQACSYGKIF